MSRVLTNEAGIVTTHHYDAVEGTTTVAQYQDCQDIVDYTQALANNSEYKRQGIKQEWYHFATVPNNVIIELKEKHGLDVFNKDDLNKIESVLTRHYKKLLTVDKI